MSGPTGRRASTLTPTPSLTLPPTPGLTHTPTPNLAHTLARWALWVPGDFIVYAVPIWMRLPLNHAISFVWTCYLSFLRGAKIEDGVADEAAPEKSTSRGAGKLPWTASGMPEGQQFPPPKP